MRALSLEYHDVVDPDAADVSGFPGAGPASYKLTRDDFERHLSAIARRISRPATRVTDWCASPVEDPPFFLTFDDGGVSAYTVIAEALERHGWRGHFFVTAGRVGTETFLSAVQIRELHARGHVIGSHSYTHPARMGACSRANLKDEWDRSVDLLSGFVGEQVRTASVPGGFYTRPVAETAADAGIRALFTSSPTMRSHTVGECRVLGRYTLRRWSSARTAATLAAAAWRPRLAQWTLYSTLNLARTIAGDRYTALRQVFWRSRM
jgi:peptidoglycan/xylan/chitin deacetylase (PgdA/CDA1 family)